MVMLDGDETMRFKSPIGDLVSVICDPVTVMSESVLPELTDEHW